MVDSGKIDTYVYALVVAKRVKIVARKEMICALWLADSEYGLDRAALKIYFYKQILIFYFRFGVIVYEVVCCVCCVFIANFECSRFSYKVDFKYYYGDMF